MMTLDEALVCADNMRTTIDAEGFACAEDFALVCLAAEVRRLREQVASDEITIELIDHRLESFMDDNARLREENPPQSLSSWQPIATAPNDVRVLLYRPTAPEWWQVMGGKYDSDEYTKNPKPYWRADNWSLGKMEQRQHTPTHWMPLPETAP